MKTYFQTQHLHFTVDIVIPKLPSLSPSQMFSRMNPKKKAFGFVVWKKQKRTLSFIFTLNIDFLGF